MAVVLGLELVDQRLPSHHAVILQRVYNFLCAVVGSDPARLEHSLVVEGYLPELRATLCPKEWAQLNYGWLTILEPHVSEFPVATYKLGHRHPYEAIILTLNGKGFSLFGKNGLKENDNPGKIDWKAGSVISPPYYWFHQHFNTGETKARYWAITEGDFPKRLGIPLDVEQIEAPQEDPGIKKRFERELGHQVTGAILPNPGLHHHGDHNYHHHHDDEDHRHA